MACTIAVARDEHHRDNSQGNFLWCVISLTFADRINKKERSQDMRSIVYFVSLIINCLAFVCFFPVTIFANGKLTRLYPGVTIYSEYYPNPAAKFKGTIIFENGSGTDISEWKSNKNFFSCVKQIGSVFIYDRNGLGKSPPNFGLSAANPLTAKLVSIKLMALLEKRNIKPPYIFVAHSYGAIYMAYFILKDPNLVKGVLLVDPVPRDFHFSDKLLNKHKMVLADAKVKPVNYVYKNYSGSEAEVAYQLLGFNESKRSIKDMGSIDNVIPIIILSSTGMEKDHPLKEDWYMSQKQWLNKNRMSKIIRISSDHFIQIKQPKEVCYELKKLVYHVSDS